MGVIDKNTGELRSTFDVLQDLSKSWENLTSVEKNELAETVAGKTQRSLFTAIMTNFDSAVGATEAALNSEGSAAQENSKRMDSLKGKVQQLQLAWQDFARNTINSEVVKSLLSLGTQLIKLADSDMGRLLITIASVSLGMNVLKKAFSKLEIVKSATSLFKAFREEMALQAALAPTTAASLDTFTVATAAAKVGVQSLTTALLANPLFWVAAGGLAIYGIAKAIDALNVTFDEHIERLDEANKKYEEAKKELDDNTNAIEEKKKRLEEINELEKTDNSSKYENEKKNIEAEVKVLEAKQKVLENNAKLAKEAAQKEAVATLQTKEAVTAVGLAYSNNTAKVVSAGSKQVDIFGKVQMQMQEYDTYLNAVNKDTKDAFQSDKSFAAEQEEKKKRLDEVKKSLLDEAQQLEDVRDKLDTSTEEGQKYADKIDDTVDGINNYIDSLDNQNESLSTQEEYLKGVKEEEEEIQKRREESQENQILENTKNYLGDIELGEDNLINTTSEYVNVVNALTQEMDLLNQAYGEQAENGSISLDTALNLINANSDYINYLTVEEGQIYLNAGAQELLNKQKIETAQQNIILANLDLIGKYANEENATKNLAGAYVELANAKAAAAAAGDVNSVAALENVQKKVDMIKSLESNPIFSGNKQRGIKSRGYSPKKYSSSGSKGKSGSSSKSTKEEYKAEIDTLYAYENALDNAKDAVDRLNDALKDTDNFNEQEKILRQLIDATNNQINKTNELKNAQSAQMNDYINQLRAQGFAIDYNASKNELFINNMQHLADFSGDTAKNLEKLIKKIQDLNDDNRSLDSSVRDLTGDVKDYYEQLEEIPEKKLKKFNELMKEFQQGRLDQIQNQIDDIQHEMDNDPRLKQLEEQIEALEKQNDEIDKQKELEEKLLAVEEAKEKLANARKQKTLQVYRAGQGFVWESDIDSIKDAADELKDAQDDLNDKIKQDQIDQLQAEKDALEKSYQDRIDALQAFLDEQNYQIDKANREGIQSFQDLQKELAKFGLDSAEYLGKATDWLNNYNKSLAELNTTVSGILSSSTTATDGLIYSSATQDRINQALSNLIPSTTSTGLTLSNIDYDKIKGSSDNSNIYINNIELPNVKDVNDFVEALKDLPRLASSQATNRT